LNLIGNWEEEEYCRSYLAALGGGVRRFDGFNICRFFGIYSSIVAMQQCIECMAWLFTIGLLTRFPWKGRGGSNQFAKL